MDKPGDSECESGERKFLHDLGSPLGTAIFIVEVLIEDMKDRSETNPDDLVQMTEVFTALDRLKKLIEGRREVLIGQ